LGLDGFKEIVKGVKVRQSLKFIVKVVLHPDIVVRQVRGGGHFVRRWRAVGMTR
jgi:hypothetical protein